MLLGALPSGVKQKPASVGKELRKRVSDFPPVQVQLRNRCRDSTSGVDTMDDGIAGDPSIRSDIREDDIAGLIPEPP
jgi:hypothetical protein